MRFSVHSHQGDERRDPCLGPTAHRCQRLARGRPGGVSGSRGRRDGTGGRGQCPDYGRGWRAPGARASEQASGSPGPHLRERVAPSPVGRQRRAWRWSGARGQPRPTWRGCAPRPTRCSLSKDGRAGALEAPALVSARLLRRENSQRFLTLWVARLVTLDLLATVGSEHPSAELH